MKKILVNLLLLLILLPLHVEASTASYENNATISFYESEVENGTSDKDSDKIGKLPKTGENTSSVVSILGILISGTVIVWHYRRRRKVK